MIAEPIQIGEFSSMLVGLFHSRQRCLIRLYEFKLKERYIYASLCREVLDK